MRKGSGKELALEGEEGVGLEYNTGRQLEEVRRHVTGQW
jgi:hypothetical protein